MAKKTPEWFDAKFSNNTRLRIRITEHLFEFHSKFQKIAVMESADFGRVLLLDDIINVTERDEFIYHEMMAHVPLFTHPDPKRVLVVGGGDGGVVREVARHPAVQKIHLVEIDAEVVNVCRRHFPQVSCCLSDPRVSIHHSDAADYVRSHQSGLDVIIVDSTDPVGAGEKLFGPAFYKSCFSALADNGVMTAQSESPFFDPDIVLSLYRTAREVFPIVRMYIAFMPSYVSGIWSFLYCSKQIDPVSGFQRNRYEQTRITTRYYSDEMHSASFALPPFIKERFSFYE